MRLKFKELKMHHFMSSGDIALNLNDAMFTSIRGINSCSYDNAKSNGSGKSTIWNALCYALTGKTIQGSSSNIQNMYFNDDAVVELVFDYVGDDNKLTTYKLIRTKSSKKSDLSIFTKSKEQEEWNDISGKGIKESTSALEKLLPDLTYDLISNVIILGQGMPNKFTNNTPSGRKEVLEKLSKSDFMITDLKDRVSRRSIELSSNKRDLEDNILKNKTLITSIDNQIHDAENKLVALNNTNTFELLKSIEEFNNNITLLSNDIAEVEKEIAKCIVSKEAIHQEINDNQSTLKEYQDTLLALQEDKNKLLLEKINNKKSIEDKYAQDLGRAEDLINDATLHINQNRAEITRINNIKDICPTCGQKLVNVVKPSTEEFEQAIKSLEEDITSAKETKTEISNKINEEIATLENEYLVNTKNIEASINDINVKRSTIQTAINEFNNNLVKEDANINNYNRLITDKTNSINNYKMQINNINCKIATLEESKNELANDINKLTQSKEDCAYKISSNETELNDVVTRLDVIKKMSTSLQRDFRGYLLKNVIEYIERRAKEYCRVVFGTDNFTFALDGNNIEVSYNSKSYDCLSGGEKQRVDLIIQFSIRDMLCKQLNFSSNILVLDEIMDNLDDVCANNVIKLILTKLDNVENIFVVSHHIEELNIPFDKEITVEKNEEGISNIY